MATFIALIDFTTQGVKSIAQSPARSEEFVKRVESEGIKVKDLYWTTGSHDGVLIIDAPSDEVAFKVFLELAQAGNVRTKSLRAFDRAEFAACLPG